MPFPKTCDELTASGYSISGHGTCRGCGADIEWGKTPLGKSIPMDPMERGATPAVSHWSTCSDAAKFRSGK